MATIKTKVTGGVRRVLLKDGKVSCSCCGPGPEPDCCYYAASLFESGWLEEDLPPTMRFGPYGQNDSETVVVSRNGLVYGPHSFSGEYAQKYELALVEGQYRWCFYVNTGEGWEIAANFNCLFQDPQSPGTWLFDDFEDTYSVEVYFESVDPPSAGSFTIVRESLCVWSGIDPTISGSSTLSFSPDERQFSWSWLNGATRIDSGPYNGPTGTYQESNLIYVVL